MNKPIDVQFISQDGKPAFAVLPYSYYLELTEKKANSKVLIPHEVVGLCLEKNVNLIAAWRIHKGMSQSELATHMGITQPAVAQMEKAEARTQKRTLVKAARALGVKVAQLQA